jgi:hypothetical protein
MAYVGNKYRGLGQDEGADAPDLSQWVDPHKMADVLRQKAEVEQRILAAKQKASAEIDKLGKNPLYGPILSKALDGARSPAAIAERANRLAQGVASLRGNNVKQEAFRLFYSQARAGMTMLDDYLSMNPAIRCYCHSK